MLNQRERGNKRSYILAMNQRSFLLPLLRQTIPALTELMRFKLIWGTPRDVNTAIRDDLQRDIVNAGIIEGEGYQADTKSRFGGTYCRCSIVDNVSVLGRRNLFDCGPDDPVPLSNEVQVTAVLGDLVMTFSQEINATLADLRADARQEFVNASPVYFDEAVSLDELAEMFGYPSRPLTPLPEETPERPRRKRRRSIE